METTSTVTGGSFPATTYTASTPIVLDFRPQQNAVKIGVAFTELVKAMLETERHLRAVRGES